MSKVRVSKMVANAIEYFLHNERLSCSEIVWQSFQVDQHTTHGGIIRDFASNDFKIFISSLINGYEVEETPEDKVRRYYEGLKAEGYEWERTHQHSNSGNPYFAEMQGIAKTIGILNIKIEGVNA